jgi:flagellar motility protein MotE (MotC chaperone)
MMVDFKVFFRKLRILPILIIVASFGFIVRMGETYVGIKSMSGSAYAEEAKKTSEEKPIESAKEKSEDLPKEPAADELKKSDAEADVSKTEESKDKQVEEPSSKDKWQDASDTEAENSAIKGEVYQELLKRRLEVEEKEKKIGEREALLEAAQKELNKKFIEMEGLRDELKELLQQQTAAEATRLQSLVKIYSGMKPKDAARIFNTLDSDILLDVIGGMPESKSGAIMALMEADRAKAITTLLAEQKKLPEVP